MERGAIYVRVSGIDDDRTASLETQEAETRAKLDGYLIGPEDVYVEHFTGKMLHERPTLNQLRDRIRSRYYSALGIHSLDRLARKATYLSVIFEEAERYGCKIISATEDIENSPEGELMRAVRGYVADVEHIKIFERTHRGKKKLLDDGQILCAGRARYGYRYVKTTRERIVCEPEAIVVRQIFTLAAEGTPVRTICSILNAQGVSAPRKRERGWIKTTIRHLLRDSSYYGQPMNYNKSKTVGRKENGRAQVEYLPPAEHRAVGQPTPPIVDQALWHRAQTTLDRARSYASSVSRTKAFRILSGMIKCKCGRTMTIQHIVRWKKKGPPYQYYVCMSKREVGAEPCDNPRQHVEVVEAEVWRRVLSIVEDKTALQQAIDRARGGNPNWEVELAAHRQAIRAAEETATKLINALGNMDDEVISKPLQTRLEVLAKRTASHRAAVEEIESRRAEREGVALGISQVLELFHRATSLGEFMDGCTLLEQGEMITPETKRAVLLSLGTRVVLDRNTVLVELSVPLANQNHSVC